jgi:cyanophycinase-like exopeptidase
VSHKLVLAQQEIAKLQAANKAATQRKSHKRKQVKAGGALITRDSLRLATLKEFGAHSDGKKAKKRARRAEGEPTQRRCGQCNQTGHNARTCKKDVEVVSK